MTELQGGQATEVRVVSDAGPIVGLLNGEAAEFRGIPYAVAPLAGLRWRSPVRRPRFLSDFDARHQGATPQRVPLSDVTSIPEPSVPGDDILNLNVFTPARALDSDRKGPVMFWIHGGAYLAGSPSGSWYDGAAAFVRDGVTVVSITYRLAFDGFGWLPDADLNRGIRDCICALEWVRDNIASFGGDPDRVTIAGQSAGAGLVLSLMASPAADGLFARAVSISAVSADLSISEATACTSGFARGLGVEPTMQGFASVSDVQIQRFIRAEFERSGDDGPLALSPIRGDEMLPHGIIGGVEVNSQRIPLLIGSTTQEFESPEETERLFHATCTTVAHARSHAPAPTWLYSFDHVSSFTHQASHCLDLPYWWDVLDDPMAVRWAGLDAPRMLAARMHGDFSAFIRGSALGWEPIGGRGHEPVQRYGDEIETTTGVY